MKKTTWFILFIGGLFTNLHAQQNILDYSLLDHHSIKGLSASAENESLAGLIDKDVFTYYEAPDFSGEVWIQINTRSSFLVTGYSLVSSDDAACDPQNFRLEGSNDGSNWARIGTTAMGKNFPGRRQALPILFNVNHTAYSSYRLVVLKINGGSDLKIAEFQLFGHPETEEEDLTQSGNVTLTGEFPGSGSDVLANIKNSNPNQIFKQNNQKTAWFQYEFPEATAIAGYSLLSTTNANWANNFRSWKLLASNDAQNWEVLDVRSNKNGLELSNNWQVYPIVDDTKKYDWAACADFAQQTLIDLFWKNYGSGYYLIHATHANPDSVNLGFNYWWMAHALDVFVDAYARTQDETYKNKMKYIRNGMLSSGNNSLRNGFFDDMEWMGLACLRAYQVYDTYPNWKSDAVGLWNWIKLGWNENQGGGIQWVNTQPNSKNACSNAPAIILAARLYNETGEQDYLDWAKRIFDWMNDNLIFAENGLVKDSYNNNEHSWTLSYNQGTWIGACLELYRITNEQKYYDIAMRTADYVLDDREKFSPYGILYNNEGGGDGGLFKGIFMRYLSQWILSNKLDKERENKFISYFLENGKSLWESALSFPASARPACLFGNTWFQRRNDIQLTDGKGSGYDASIHLSAVMLFELLDELERNGFLPENNAHPSAAENKENTYRFYRLEVEANNGGNHLELARWQLFSSFPLPTHTPKIPVELPVKVLSGNHRLILINETNEDVYYAINHLNGGILSSGILSSGHTELDFPQGVYIVKIINNNKKIHTCKTIVY